MDHKIVLDKDVEIFGRAVRDDPAQAVEEDDFSYLELRGRMVTITPVMKEILEACREPLTAKEVVQMLSDKEDCTYESIYLPVTAFLKRMVKLGVLVFETDLKKSKPALLEELEAAKKFQDFNLLDELGRNRKVLLYKCSRDGADDIFYTIKLYTGARKSESFMREFEIVRGLPPHKNIRKCIAASVHGNVPFIVFDYVEGEPLSNVTEDFSIDTKYSIAGQMLSAMAHIHRYGILHGDVHASNFLIDSRGSVSLIDFGMAYFEHEEKVDHGGVPQYMPPERMPDHNYLFSKQKGDFVSEVFQVGVCLYLLFSGDYPFYGKFLKDVRRSIQFQAPSPLMETDRGEVIPPEVSRIIYKSLEKQPTARYQAISEMLHDWTAIMKEEDVKINLLDAPWA